MNVLNFTALTLVAIVLSGCGSSTPPQADKNRIESKVFDYGAPPAKVRPLDVPPDLTSSVGEDRYSIPGEGESGTRFSDFSQVSVVRNTNNVLPAVKNVHLENTGTQRWLVVNDKAENIWPLVKAFWLENGLSLKTDNPQAGVMETEWAENKAKVPMDGFRRSFGQAFKGLLSSGESDQFHTRLERSKDGNSTSIYIVHYGMQEVAEKNDTGFRWLPRATDHELEATMLQLLMVKLGGGSGVLDKTKLQAGTTETASATSPKLNKLADGSQRIVLSEPFDKSWRKVGLALEQAGIILADKDRSKGIYLLSSGKDDIKGKQGSDNLTRIQVNVKETASGCDVQVSYGSAGSNAETQKIIDMLFKTLSKIQ